MSYQFYFSPYILDNLVPPRAGFDVVQDAAESRLRMYITSRGVKTFFTRKRVRGHDVRIIIGNYPNIDIETARTKVSQLVKAAAAHPKIRRKKITFGAAAIMFVTKKVKRTPASTTKLIRTMARLWDGIYPVRIDEITSMQISKLNEKIAKNSGIPTANRMREVMSGIFKFMIEQGYATENPAADVVPFKESRRKQTLTGAGLRRIIESINAEKDMIVRSAFLMLVYGFAGRSKVFAMQWRDLDFNGDTWENQPLSDAAVVVLRNLPQQKQFVFPSKTYSRKQSLLAGPSPKGRRPMSSSRAAWARIISRARLHDIQMNDIHKFMMSRLEWSGDREIMRRNMNAVIGDIQ
ncbi:MAG: integrase family protein [Rickettsiales bacterium]|jgi:integrase|nr:integrase family protein [Rickettsiales bacterium]